LYRQINRYRLAALVSVILFGALMVWSDSWKTVYDYPSRVREFQYRIVAEDYAENHGTTVEEINRKFLNGEEDRYREERKRGLADCIWFQPKNISCARPPITNGGPLIGFPKNSLAEVFEASTRALPSLTSLARDLLTAIFGSVLLCLVAPFAFKQIWSWLRVGGSNAN
jgi:hypothetical protein